MLVAQIATRLDWRAESKRQTSEVKERPDQVLGSVQHRTRKGKISSPSCSLSEKN